MWNNKRDDSFMAEGGGLQSDSLKKLDDEFKKEKQDEELDSKALARRKARESSKAAETAITGLA